MIPLPLPHGRIVLILPCCIGDVVLATATLKALRQACPDGHITWAVGSWSAPAIAHHDLLNAVLDTGPAALPVKRPADFVRLVVNLRAGKYDLAVSLVRSPLMSLAVMLSEIPLRAGLDSNGRGFGYNVRARVNPATPRHEAEIYLDVARALGLDTDDCYANVPVWPADQDAVRRWLDVRGIDPARLLVINPAGGSNPGMVMDSKRWPPYNFGLLAQRLAARFDWQVVVIGGPGDAVLVDAAAPTATTARMVGGFSFGEIAALAHMAQLYIGNDTGMTHLAAASGGRTVMILGPSDPARYAPFTPDSLALWQPVELRSGGVAAGTPDNWDWARDGISVDAAEARIVDYLQTGKPRSQPGAR